MVKISDLDEFLHAEHINNGDIIKITGKAIYISAEASVFDRSYLQIPIRTTDDKSKTWTPNRTTLKKLAETFGDDTDKWVGKEVKLMIVKQNVHGKMLDVIYGEAATKSSQQQTQANLQ